MGEGDVGFALLRVVRRQGHADDFRFGAGEFEDDVRQLGDREFVRVADIDRPREVVGRCGHHAQHSLDQVVDILETAGLLAVAVDGDLLAAQRLHDEIRNHAAVVDVHFRAVGVEYADDFHRNAVFAVVAHEERLGAAFAFVVARAQSQRVYVSPVILRLGMDQRVAVYFGSRSLQDFCVVAVGDGEHVHGAYDRGLRRLDRVVLVVDRRCRAGEVVNLLDFGHIGVDDVVADDFEVGVFQQMADVALVSREVVVDADDVVALFKQAFTQVGTDESGTTGDEYSLHWHEIVLIKACKCTIFILNKLYLHAQIVTR